MKIKNATTRAVIIILTSIAILVGISYLPLEKWSGGRISNFNLLSDIVDLPDIHLDADSTDRAGVDPFLVELERQSREGATMEIPMDMPDDTPGLSAAPAQIADSIAPFVDRDTIVQPVKANRAGQLVTIEDYTTGNVGLARLKSALRSGRLARIALVGDSYIEGDIFAQNLRENLQNAYGGEGVGYVNMYSEFPGFRRSVKQGGSGWKGFSALKKGGNKSFYGLAEQYFMPTGAATSTYKGVTALAHLDQWTRSRFLFIAPNNTTVSVRTNEGEWEAHEVTGDPGVQCIMVAGPTTEFAVKTSDTRLVGLGVWLDGTSGVSLDCMSSRGFSGITLTGISTSLCRAMSRDINYDLIILEFGINAMSAGQTNYTVYSNRMIDVINHVRTCYPNADILLMGIGDRGQKKGGAVHSMSVAANMVAAQRDAARKAHCLFWDTREAMGGEDAIVEWSRQKLVNKDYIHLTHAGGKRLADLLYDALSRELK